MLTCKVMKAMLFTLAIGLGADFKLLLIATEFFNQYYTSIEGFLQFLGGNSDQNLNYIQRGLLASLGGPNFFKYFPSFCYKLLAPKITKYGDLLYMYFDSFSTS